MRSRSVSAEQLRERLSRTGTRVSVQTVRNRLHSAGLRARRPYVGVPLSQRHRQARLAWTRQHRRWTNQQWATVLFTDESRFLLDMLDRRRRVWRRRGERYANCAIVEHDRYGGGSLMVWGGISVRSRTELLVLNGTLTGQRYINEVLQPVVLPFVQQHQVVLQDDNARPHRARIEKQFLQQNNVDHLEWPARSPTCRQSSMFGTFSASVYNREFHDQERSKLWPQPCRMSGGGYPSYRLPVSSAICVVGVWPA
ncbi:MAG: transposase [Candidatus Thiodiazotropha sp.]